MPATDSRSSGITERAFLLLKPDCLAQRLTGAVERAIAAAGLRIDHRRKVTLSPADVRFLWSEYDDAGNCLTLAFLDRYLTTAPSEFLLVSGAEAFQAARRIKREIRSRHAGGPFANVVHAAERPGELARQGNRLMDGPMPFVAGDSSLNPARPRGLDFRELFDVAALAGEVWPLTQEAVPVDPGVVRLSDTGQLTVVLGPDPGHTLDSTVTALWHALPGVPPRRAVLLALHIGWSGGTPIAVGDRKAIDRCHRVLREHGIRNCGTGENNPGRLPRR